METVSTPETKPQKSELCSDWDAVTKAFGSFPAPKLDFDPYGQLTEQTWIFRGHKDAEYPLQPRIEREKPGSWAAVEWLVLQEFRAKARMHIDPYDLPPSDEKLSWLALMQHYGVWTRLLDFTFSPYIALYFALRERTKEEQKSPAVRMWAINARALLDQAALVSNRADREQEEHQAQKLGKQPTLRATRFDPADAISVGAELQGLYKSWSGTIAKALDPEPKRRDCFNEHGFVVFASPPVQTRRLSSQQGTFLFSGAEDLTFEKSLFKMMSGRDGWYRQFKIPSQELPELERRLLQMNVHDLSLFPDMEGLAGFIRQKARLHWVPNDSLPADQ